MAFCSGYRGKGSHHILAFTYLLQKSQSHAKTNSFSQIYSVLYFCKQWHVTGSCVIPLLFDNCTVILSVVVLLCTYFFVCFHNRHMKYFCICCAVRLFFFLRDSVGVYELICKDRGVLIWKSLIWKNCIILFIF